MQLLEERDAELERSEASLEGHKKAGDAREEVSTSPSLCLRAMFCCSHAVVLWTSTCITGSAAGLVLLLAMDLTEDVRTGYSLPWTCMCSNVQAQKSYEG